MIAVLAVAIALLGGFVMGYAAKCRRARMEGYLAGRLDQQLAFRKAIDEIAARHRADRAHIR